MSAGAPRYEVKGDGLAGTSGGAGVDPQDMAPDPVNGGIAIRRKS